MGAVAHDPLYEMSPDDRDWWSTVADEAEALASAIWSDNDERRDRKVSELRHALARVDESSLNH